MVREVPQRGISAVFAVFDKEEIDPLAIEKLVDPISPRFVGGHHFTTILTSLFGTVTTFTMVFPVGVFLDPWI